MCPVCLTTAAVIAAGTGVVASLTTVVLGKQRAERNPQVPAPTPQAEEK